MLSPLHWLSRDAPSLLRQIEAIEERIDHEDYEGPADQEDDTMALLAYLHGTCLAVLGEPHRAIRELEIVLRLKNKLVQHVFLVPHAMIELAKCYNALGNNERSQNMLHNGWKRFFTNSLKSRLLSNIYKKMEMIQNAMAANGLRRALK
ncbi:unnamed protein product [Parnassius apollo]|uniref:(apollo) hypothetical protein n=1 Tax=Parnassius apollo TaxID=110799 RepID=A0A8S3XT01_PARAO|nr:unnamed protein product [Parnassius apollo]